MINVSLKKGLQSQLNFHSASKSDFDSKLFESDDDLGGEINFRCICSLQILPKMGFDDTNFISFLWVRIAPDINF